MLKTQRLELMGGDAGTIYVIREIPALPCDRLARAILKECELPQDGGVVSLAFKYIDQVRRILGERAPHVLQQFVEQAHPVLREIKDWRNVERVQNAALALHAGFIIDRDTMEMPVRMQAEILKHTDPERRLAWASPFIIGVLNSHLASYAEMETMLSTEDVFNLSELVTHNAVQEFTAAARADRPN